MVGSFATIEPRAHATRDPSVDAYRLDSDQLVPMFGEEWEAHGARIFRFDIGMYETLRDTEIPTDLECAELQLPFPCVQFRFMRADGTELLLWPCQDDEGVIIVGALGGDDVDVLDAELATWRFLALSYDTGRRVLGAMEGMLLHIAPGPGHLMARQALTATWNAILYLSSPRTVTEVHTDERLQLLRAKLERLKAKKKKRRVRRAIEREEVFVGDIVVKPPERVALPTLEASGWKMTIRTKTRGHWKKQAYGPGRLLRRRIFVDSYWRGPDTAAVVYRDYQVKS